MVDVRKKSSVAKCAVAGMASVVALVTIGSASAQADTLPEFLPAPQAGETVAIIGGTGDPNAEDMQERTVGNGWFDQVTNVLSIKTPASFGISRGGESVLPIIVGDGVYTYNGSTVVGAQNVEQVINATDGKITLVTMSQGANVVYDAIYNSIKNGSKDSSDITAYLLAPPRFENTGMENVLPSFIPGGYTNGNLDSAATGDAKLSAICVGGDPTCGFNPYSLSSYIYIIPGFLQIHSNEYGDIGEMTVVRVREDGNITYVSVMMDENPWGAFLRANGVPVSEERFDKVMDLLLPVDVPGERSTIHGKPLQTPRELQVALYEALGWQVPVTAPDQIDTQVAEQSPSPYAVTMPVSVATGVDPEPVVETPVSETPLPFVQGFNPEQVSSTLIASFEDALTSMVDSSAGSWTLPQNVAPSSNAVTPSGESLKVTDLFSAVSANAALSQQTPSNVSPIQVETSEDAAA